MTKKQKKLLKKLLISVFLYIAAIIAERIFNIEGIYKILLFLPVYVVAGYDVLISAAKRIISLQFLDENFLMAIASIGAFSIGDFEEAIFVMVLYNIGQLFESVAVGKSRKSIKSLMSIKPETANVVLENGETEEKQPSDVPVGSIILVKPGERFPIDGIVESGKTTADTKALTGESVPLEIKEGDKAVSGYVNLSGTVKVKTTASFKDSTVSKILEMVENSVENKAKAENFITRFARYYTPIVVALAIVVGLIVPVFVGDFSVWLKKGLVFLVISCPCALVISVPLTFFCGIGKASDNGILVKGSEYIDRLSLVDTAVFDKTGTLTKGNFSVVSVHPEGIESDELLKITASAEQFSNHPIAKALLKSAGELYSDTEDVREISGLGIEATINGKKVLVGSRKLVGGNECDKAVHIGTLVYASVDGKYAGHIEIADEIKEGSKQAIKLLKENGIKKTVMLTGDREQTAESVANAIKIDKYYASLMPNDKVKIMESLIGEGKVLFVGDGINDAPAIARADVGIAMGGCGQDIAIEAADVVIMDDNPEKIPEAIKISKKTKKIVIENIVFSLAVKLMVMLVSVYGDANMWLAAFADVGVSVIAILNAVRAKR